MTNFCFLLLSNFKRRAIEKEKGATRGVLRGDEMERAAFEGWLEREGRTHDIIPSSSLRGQSSGFSKCAQWLLLRERLLLP